MEGVMISRAQIAALNGMRQASAMFLLTQRDLGAISVKDTQGHTRQITIEGRAIAPAPTS